MSHHARLALRAAFIVAAMFAPALAGPLEPPAGPISSTHKTLTETEPRTAINLTNTPGTATAIFRIAEPGSYYLTGNVTGSASAHGIVVAADNVTIDLLGFTLQGVPNSLSGITLEGGRNYVTVRNGFVRGWGDRGIDLGAAAPDGIGMLVERVTASDNAVMGIQVRESSIVRDCIAANNGGFGIWTSFSGVIHNCYAYQNGTGIAAGSASSVSNCAALNNVTSGISCVSTTTITNSSARGNANGIAVTGSGCHISSCAVNANTTGIVCIGEFAVSVTIVNCSIANNTQSGIVAGRRSSIIACTISANGAHGVTTAEDCTISRCDVHANTLDGIRTTFGCVISHNNCNRNGTGSSGTAGAGIHTTGFDNRIDSNHCIGNGRGIDVDASGSFIVRNTCSGNTTNWDLAADNRHGGITNVTAFFNAAVVGLGGAPTAITTSDPHANFSF